VPRVEVSCPSHIRKLQVLKCKCLRLATGAPWYVSNRQIHEDLSVPLFADHIRAMTESFNSVLGDVEKPLLWQLGRHILTDVLIRHLTRKLSAAGDSRPFEAIARDGQVDKTNRVRR
jgi:hypothetical protein